MGFYLNRQYPKVTRIAWGTTGPVRTLGSERHGYAISPLDQVWTVPIVLDGLDSTPSRKVGGRERSPRVSARFSLGAENERDCRGMGRTKLSGETTY